MQRANGSCAPGQVEFLSKARLPSYLNVLNSSSQAPPKKHLTRIIVRDPSCISSHRSGGEMADIYFEGVCRKRWLKSAPYAKCPSLRGFGQQLRVLDARQITGIASPTAAVSPITSNAVEHNSG